MDGLTCIPANRYRLRLRELCIVTKKGRLTARKLVKVCFFRGMKRLDECAYIAEMTRPEKWT